MGMAHNKPETFPRLADHLGWVPADKMLAVAEAVVTTQRDYGDREDRSHARLKYTIADRGVKWFRHEVAQRADVLFVERVYKPWRTPSYLGWKRAQDGSFSLGFHLLSGRINNEGRPLQKALRHLIEHYNLNVVITAEQDLILLGINEGVRDEIDAYLANLGIDPQSPAKLYDRALTCVALPMCIKALAEAERVGPEIFRGVNHLLHKHRLASRAPVMRITGCPNGCARPYAAEIGLVGQLPKKYALYLGGHPEGTRLAFRAMEKVPEDDLPELLDRLFGFWKSEGEDSETLGDFVTRVDRDRLLAVLKEADTKAIPVEIAPEATL